MASEPRRDYASRPTGRGARPVRKPRAAWLNRRSFPRKAAVPASRSAYLHGSRNASRNASALPPTLSELLERAIADAGSAPFLGVRTSTVREQSLTYEAFGVAVEHASARLALALRPGDRVLVQGSPGPGFAAAVFAAARASVILVPLDSRMEPDTIERISRLTEPSAILLGGGATLEPVTIPLLAGLPVLDLDDLIDPPDRAAAGLP